ncbi:MAG: trypsin-like peptidase domain-containing protein [Ardenticatenaceae bacterium]|nr:trypsin-like peptidase domain-containing protein [Ardenticatenaceae bacterium]
MDRTLTFRVSAGLNQGQPATQPTPAAGDSAAGGMVTTLDAVKSATIQIEAQGSFVDPQVGLMLNAAGRGSGVIIDPSGIAITNNHVVTGAALIKVWVGGETEPRNARILGVSECSDLAVIDIDGEGYPYLGWYEGDLSVGLDVYAAGFPLGDPEFTLTRGIISKARASGETNWASVDSVIEHDATINPGNSGGPLVNASGQLVGINYAGSNEVNQYFAIARDEARSVIEQLRAGQDVTSIGINGQAVSDGQSIFGIWVSSVKSGSPADKAGILSGDIITTLEGLVLATDGTMADYCDILRTHNPTDTMNVEILRYDTQEVLAGQLNGRELAQVFSFAQELENTTPDEPANTGSSGGTAVYDSYTTITDDSGTLTLEVPTAWSDVNGGPWEVDGQAIGQQLSAAPSLDGYYNSWNTPGVVFAVSTDIAATYTEEELLDNIDFSSECTYDSRNDYADELYTGYYDIWTGCGGSDTLFIVIATEPASGSQTLLVQVQVVTDADLDALDHILASFVASE